MLAEARRCCDARGLDNVMLIDPSRLDELVSDFDLITCQLVFQRIPPRAGSELARRLTARLAPGGVAMLHFSLTPGSALTAIFYWTLRSVPPARGIWNVMRGRDRDYPFMDMNRYRLERLLRDVHAAGIDEVAVRYAPAPSRTAGRGAWSAFSQATLIYARPTGPDASS